MRTRLYSAISLLLLAAVLRPARAQRADAGPLGVVITPPDKVVIPAAMHSAVPTGAVVRLLQPTQLAPEGEHVIVYDSGKSFEPDSHIVVVRSRDRVADFSLTKLFEKDDIGDTYALFSAAQFLTRVKTNAFLAAFRNIGSGAGSIFVLLAYKGGSYQVAWRHWTQQAQIRVRRDGRMQLWESSADGQCTWCPQHYQVSTLEWKNGTASRVDRFTTKQTLNPEDISAIPIVIEK